MLAVYIVILLTCHLTSGQVGEEMNGPVIPVRSDGSFYNTAELIELQNRKGETHYVTTEDGYVLAVFRLLSTQQPAPVVLLQHGFLGSSDCWVTDADALAFKMSDAGFDVWISNTRGNVYSRNHTTLKPHDKEFWNFSWHEMGSKDLPAVIEHVLQKTGDNKLHYIGHSMGCSVSLVLLSVRPEYNKRLRSMIALAPAAFFSNIREFVGPGGVAEELAANFMRQFKTSGKAEVFPRSDVTSEDHMQITCNDVGENFSNICSDMIKRFQNSLSGAYIPAGQSLKTLDHFYQSALYGSMMFYNMSKEENVRAYGSEEPPAYSANFKRITVPVLIWSSDADRLVAPKDVDDLVSLLPNVVSDIRVKEECFNHETFLLTRTSSCIPVRAKIYSDIIEAIKQL